MLPLLTFWFPLAMAQDAGEAEAPTEGAASPASESTPSQPEAEVGAPSPYDLSSVLGAQSDCEEGPTEPGVDLTGAQQLDGLTDDQLDFLKPRLSELPYNFRQQTDFTAYTLEPGEVRLGLNTYMGVFSNIHVGTNLGLDALGVYNGALKIGVIQEGPFEVSVRGMRYQILQPEHDYSGSYTLIGSTVSLRMGQSPVGLHAGGDYVMLRSTGIPNLGGFAEFLGADQGLVDMAEDELGLDSFELFGSLVRIRGAVDIGFNRRDSLLLQFSSPSKATLESDLPDDLTQNEYLSMLVPNIGGLSEMLQYDGKVPVSEFYAATLAYQARWRRAELKVGLGYSPIDWSWTAQAIDFSYRLGGKTRITEKRMRRTWRKNRRHNRKVDVINPEESLEAVGTEETAPAETSQEPTPPAEEPSGSETEEVEAPAGDEG